MHPAGVLGPSLNGFQSVQNSRWELGMTSFSQSFVLQGMKKPALLERISGSGPISLQPTALAGGSHWTSVFCMQPQTLQPHFVGPCNPFTVQVSNLPAQLDSVGMNCAFNLVSWLPGWLHAQGVLASHTSAPFKKVCGTHTAVQSHCLILCVLPLPDKAKTLSWSGLAMACQCLQHF